VDVDCGCVPIELPICELLLELIRLFELTAGCLVAVEGRVITRFVVFVGCREPMKPRRVEFLVPILIEVDVRVFELVVDCEGIIRLDVILVELLPGWRTLDILGVLFRFIELDLFVDLTRG